MFIAGLVAVGLAYVPLLGVHGVESALLLGVVLPPFTALIGARLVVRCRREKQVVSAIWLLGASVWAAVVVVAIPMVLLALNSLRIRNCSPLQGLLFMVLGPVFSVVLSSLAGVVIGGLITRSRAATALAVALPLATYAIALGRLYETPAIFAYGHFFGFFPGTFYDEDIGFPTALLTLRAVSLVLGCGLVALFVSSYDKLEQRLKPGFRDPESIFLSSLALMAFAVAALAQWFGPELGHRSTQAWIEQQLETRIEINKCRAHFPRELDRAEARRLAAECEFRVAQMEKWFGVRQQKPVVAFFFRSAEEKRRLMGAHTTYIAKPWLSQVYLQLHAWPHPVLAHEIAHIVAANCGAGPFRIAGRFGGLWPNPALIEGVAVAAAWSDSDELTPHQWSRAMIEIGMAPRLRELFGAGFFGQSKRRAYNLSGSLVRYIKDEYGAGAIRRLYASGDVASAIGVGLDELEKKWRDFAMQVALPDSALELARARFAQGSVFSTVCPHKLARLHSQLGADRAAKSYDEASERCREILGIDPNDRNARVQLVSSLARNGELDAAERELKKLQIDYRAPAPVLASARQEIADAHWRLGRDTEALRIYRDLLRLPLENDAARLLEVKLLALEAGAEQAELLFELLVGSDGVAADSVTAVYLARELREVRSDGLAYYLEARQLFFRQRFEAAAKLLHLANQAALPSRRLSLEARRLEGISSYALGDFRRARELFSTLERESEALYREQARDWLERIQYAALANHGLATESPRFTPTDLLQR